MSDSTNNIESFEKSQTRNTKFVIPSVISFIIVIFLIIFLATIIPSWKEAKEKENNLVKGISLLKQEKYDEAISAVILDVDFDKYKGNSYSYPEKVRNAISVYSYAAAMTSDNENVALLRIDDILPIPGEIDQKDIDKLKTDIVNKYILQNEEQRKKFDDSVKNLRKTYDEVEDYAFYKDTTTTEYIDKNSFHLFIFSEKDKNPVLCLQIQYAAESWLFINKYIIRADDRLFEINPDFGKVHQETESGGIYEWYRTVVNTKSDLFEMINAVISSNKATLRYKGSKGVKDKEITVTEKYALKNVLDAYTNGSNSALK